MRLWRSVRLYRVDRLGSWPCWGVSVDPRESDGDSLGTGEWGVAVRHAQLAEPSSIHFTAVIEEIVSFGVAKGCTRVALADFRR